MKICKKCNQEKELSNFYNKKDTIDKKHIYCKICLKKENTEWYQNSKENRKEYYKKYREENKEYFNNYCHNHYHTKKELYREWNNFKYNNDLEFKIKHVVSSRIYVALKTYNELKKDRTIEYLGCSIEEYNKYLENKFTSEMTWENYGIYWEIDHIKPISSFDLSKEKELYNCFYYTNTQPLTVTENRHKSNKF